ncbi:MAG TPA: dTDP-4-dehydrorhamnose reductase [Gemmatimonadales bacterium]|nr:dTDP-4-dehydrorhamnose reductase [Gemmatimonadales bacterium]
MSSAPPTDSHRRALITGGGGQLGQELRDTVPTGWTALSCTSAEFDVTRPGQVGEVLERVRPAVVINAAAYTGVDAAEQEPARAHAVNAAGAANVAAASRVVGARLIQVSTDYVFGGALGRPYLPDDRTEPLGVYGRTKLEGEREVMRIAADTSVILRTAWLYSGRGRNFVLTMLRLFREREEVGVVCDQVGTPTWCRSAAEAIWAAAQRPDVSGIHHWTDEGMASWYELALAVQEEALALGLLQRPVPIRPLRSDQYPTPARRPSYSVLDASATEAALGLRRRPWRVTLHLMLQELVRA